MEMIINILIPESIVIINLLVGTLFPFIFAREYIIQTYMVSQDTSMLGLSLVFGYLAIFNAFDNTFLSTIFAFHINHNVISRAFEVAIIALSIITLYIIISYVIRKFDIVLAILCGLLGALFMIIAGDLLIMYLGLELLSISTYILLASNTTARSSIEAGIKYLLFSALSSLFILLGIAITYAIIGTTNITYSSIFNELANVQTQIGNLFILVGLSFKLGLFPFHTWVPDVYQGAPLYAILFLIMVPKLAYIHFIVTLILQYTSSLKMTSLSYLGILSIFFSGIAAINQGYILRILGYSTINNMGICVLPLALGTLDGILVSVVYLLVYLVLTSLIFCILGTCYIVSFFDMSYLINFPILSIFFAFIMFSNAGIPPLVGFFGKYFVISTLYTYMEFLNGGAVIIGSAISSFFYIRLISYLYFIDTSLIMNLIKQYMSGLSFSLSYFNIFGVAFLGGVLNSSILEGLYINLRMYKVQMNQIPCAVT